MASDFQVRLAQAGEGTVIAGLLQEAFDPTVRNLTIWGSPLLNRYIESLLEQGPRQSGYGFHVLTHSGTVVGAIANRFIAPAMHPTVMYLDATQRRRGMGTFLLAESIIDFARIFPCEEILWDVFAGRDILEAWYERLGGVELERKTWWLLETENLPAGPDPLPWTEMDAADQHHAAFGFSSLNVRWNEASIPVGRLPGPWFRVLSADPLRDPRFLATLRHLDPQRGILHIGSTVAPGALWRQQCVARRLTFRSDQLLREFATRLAELRADLAGGESR